MPNLQSIIETNGLNNAFLDSINHPFRHQMRQRPDEPKQPLTDIERQQLIDEQEVSKFIFEFQRF